MIEESIYPKLDKDAPDGTIYYRKIPYMATIEKWICNSQQTLKEKNMESEQIAIKALKEKLEKFKERKEYYEAHLIDFAKVYSEIGLEIREMESALKQFEEKCQSK